jgi:hypothetical protein
MLVDAVAVEVDPQCHAVIRFARSQHPAQVNGVAGRFKALKQVGSCILAHPCKTVGRSSETGFKILFKKIDG